MADPPARVLIADRVFGSASPAALALLRERGCEVVPNPFGRRLATEELLELARPCVGVIAGSERYTAEVLGQLPVLRCISRVGAGVDGVDMAAAERLGIVVRSTPDAPTQAVAEFTVGLMLAVLRRIPAMDRGVREGQWTRHLGAQLAGRRIGLVGLGRIGRRVAEMLRALGCAVCGYDPAPLPDWAARTGVSQLAFEQLLESSDILSLHLPYSREVHHLVGEAELRRMPRGAFLINTARGRLVDEEALRRALLDGLLGGAALDVFEQEPYAGPLLGVENVILTPHAASSTAEARERMELEAARALLEELERRPPRGTA